MMIGHIMVDHLQEWGLANELNRFEILELIQKDTNFWRQSHLLKSIRDESR